MSLFFKNGGGIGCWNDVLHWKKIDAGGWGGGVVSKTIVRNEGVRIICISFSTMKKCFNKEIFQGLEERNDKQKSILPTKLKKFSI